MGFFENRRQKAEEDRLELAEQEAQRVYAAWYGEYEEVKSLVAEVREFDGFTAAELPECSMVLKKGERAYLVGQGAQLIEPRRGPGQYVGGYAGFSFKIVKGVRFHTGSSRGTFVPGEERPTPIDEGTVTVTNQRVVFQGMKQTREWAYAKMIGVQHDPNLPWTAIQVSNRQKTSGFLYDETNTALIRFRLALAMAHFTGNIDQLVAEMDGDLAEHRAEMPPYPGAGAPAALAAGTG